MSRAVKILMAARASAANVTFIDLQILTISAGFVLARVSGSHHVYRHPNLAEIINLQPVGRKAKPYQVKQVLDLIDKYHLPLK